LQGIAKDAELRAYWTYCQQYPLPHPPPQQQQQQQKQPAAAAVGTQVGAPREVLLPLTALAHSKQLLQWLRQEHKQQQQQHQHQTNASDPAAAAEAAQPAAAAAASAAVGFDDGDVLGFMRSIRQLLRSQAAAGKLLPGEHVCLCLSFCSARSAGHNMQCCRLLLC
jgi:hypothetical protein